MPLSMHGPFVSVSHTRMEVESVSRRTSELSASSNRHSRLNSNVKTLYHATTVEAARNIVATQLMVRGNSGLASSGIYFATNPADTLHKANMPTNSHGAILEATVLLGRVKEVPYYGDTSVSFTSLLHEGYDSVLIPRKNGIEYVVYHNDQIKNIRICQYF
jgi:hypothetical protein